MIIAPRIVIFIAIGFARGSFGWVRGNGYITKFMEFFNFPEPAEERVCYSHVCNATAKNLLDSLDRSVDPCENFYSFACNGWIKNHEIPPMSIHWNQFDELNEKLDYKLKYMLSEEIQPDDEPIVKTTKMLYQACMDEETIETRGLQPLLELLRDLNGWPIITPHWNESGFRWQDLAVLVSKKIGLTPILTVTVDVDLRNTSRNIIIVEQPPLDIPAYFFTTFSSIFMKHYTAYFSRVVKLLRKKKRLTGSPFFLRYQIDEIIQFEIDLTLITRKKEEMRDLEKFHNPVTIKQLQEWTDRRNRSRGRIDWKKYIQDLLDKGESEINDETSVVVSDWEFLENLFKLIGNKRQRVIADFILWEVVKTLNRMTNKEMRKLEFSLKREVSGVKEDVPRWQECVHATDGLSLAVGYMYVKKHFSDRAKSKAIELVRNIRSEFRKELSEVKWIDEETKKAALEKADYMNHFIGYPDYYDSDAELNEYYRGLKIGKDHFRNMLALREFLAKQYLRKLDKKPSRDEWLIGPAVINAYYDPRLNSIIFPAGILESPFFNKDRPNALNYGSIGSIIGHEITHAFDDVGRQADKVGNIHQWWSKETESTYLENAQCFIEEYGKYRFPVLDKVANTEVRLNGLLTLGENIADNGGLKTALKAYLKHGKSSDELKLPGLEEFSSDQLFYLGFATMWCEASSEASLLGEVLDDSHSPHSVRVMGSVSNLQHFADTWGCSRSSEMNPVKKCQLW